jgi:Heterokaryon incompatibility protein (HET)
LEFLWADAICINQKDKDELNQQLPLIGTIYQNAEMVFVGLEDIPLQWYVAYDLMLQVKIVYSLLNGQPPENNGQLE